MKGIWEVPVDTYYGEACVCKLDHLKGQPILPEHLSNVREGDIVLMGSTNTGEDIPWIEGDTAYWLAEEKKIKDALRGSARDSLGNQIARPGTRQLPHAPGDDRQQHPHRVPAGQC